MLSIETIEAIGLTSMWMLEPRVPELLLELSRRGYATARVKPKILGGYDIMPIESYADHSGIVAIKGSTYVLYNPSRRAITIEGPYGEAVASVFAEVEEALKGLGSDPAKGVLFYELLAKARARGGRLALGVTVWASDLLGQDMLAIPTSFIPAEGDPNSTQWFHLDIRPLWTSWTDDNVRYEVVLIYRNNIEKLLGVLRSINRILEELVRRISDYPEKAVKR